MKLLLLGATGRTGKHLLEAALAGGHEVIVVVRDRNKLQPHTALKVIEGNVMQESILLQAAKECEAIISVLNISRTSDFPWAPLRSPKNLLSASTAAIIHVAQKLSIARIVYCSAWGAAESKKDIPAWFRFFINNSNIGPAYKDHERAEALLVASSLDYSIVRPTGLINSWKEKPVLVSVDNNPKPHLTISRRNLAHFLLRIAEHGSYIRQVITVSGA